MTDDRGPSRNQTLEVRRSAFGDTEVHDQAVAPLGPGQIRLHVDRFAVTANNISYAGAGDLLGYWDFFPADVDPDVWGRVPAMGWADIVESNHPDLAVGGRYYGWFPMSTTATITASPTRNGFRDDGANRQAHAPIYRAFVATDHDEYLDGSDDEQDRHAVLRVLFLTGFLADEFFADCGGAGADAGGGEPYFGARQVVVLSASSKTAIGFAQRAAQRDGVAVVGLTSAANVAFVESLGFYDQVVPYDDISSLRAVDSVVIDMAGNPAVLGAVHEHLGDHLRHSMMVGKSHHDAPNPGSQRPGLGEPSLPGPEPQFFFAPGEVERRVAVWGAQEYRSRTVDGMAEFIDGSRSWLQIEHRHGVDGVTSAWADVLAGNVAPNLGLVVSFDSP